MIKRITLFLLLLFAHSQTTVAWTVSADFESGAIGSPAEGPSGFATSRDNTFFSNNYSRNGSKSAKAGINAGSESGMGGTFFFDVKPGQGDELWWSCSVFFPSGFDYSATGAGLKLMRVQVYNAGGTSEGYHNMLIKGDGISITSQVSNEDLTANNPVRHGLGGSVSKNNWHTFETYFKFSTGKGIWRIWRNGNLIFEDEETYTLKTSGAKAERALIFTYWNGSAPKTQAAYIDDCVVTSDTPSKYDSSGNPFIGVGASSGVAPPKSPTWP